MSERFEQAKQRYTEAIKASMQGQPDAERLCTQALAELDQARRAAPADLGAGAPQ